MFQWVICLVLPLALRSAMNLFLLEIRLAMPSATLSSMLLALCLRMLSARCRRCCPPLRRVVRDHHPPHAEEFRGRLGRVGPLANHHADAVVDGRGRGVAAKCAIALPTIRPAVPPHQPPAPPSSQLAPELAIALAELARKGSRLRCSEAW